jgi:hypothetical protein
MLTENCTLRHLELPTHTRLSILRLPALIHTPLELYLHYTDVGDAGLKQVLPMLTENRFDRPRAHLPHPLPSHSTPDPRRPPGALPPLY